jgi:hypothetical protein
MLFPGRGGLSVLRSGPPERRLPRVGELSTGQVNKTERNGVMKVHLINRTIRLVSVMTVAAAAAMTIAASTAGASVTAPARTATHSTTAHAAPSPATKSTPKTKNAPLAPAGCNNGNLCEYNAGNGGNLCFQTNRNTGWPGGCAYHNEGEYNRNGNGVYMYGPVAGHTCDYLLYSGHYLLYNANDHFEGGGGSCTSYTLEHKLGWSDFI